MELYINPERKEWHKLCQRNNSDDSDIYKSVKHIIDTVREQGDQALIHYAKQFDGIESPNITVDCEEIKNAGNKVSEHVKKAIDIAIANISTFHRAQLPKPVEVITMPGVRCVQRALPIERVGLYIPGGRAPLFSTVLMLALPAKIAGCKSITLCTPRSADYGIAPEILYAATMCGVNEIYAVGGAQAIAAMAYGTSTIMPVNKIFGPGNRYVTKAKQIVTDQVAIDMPAGPSEVLVLADNTADPLYVAADLLSQAEHGPDSQAMLVCHSTDFAKKVFENIDYLRNKLSRNDIITSSLAQSRTIIFESIGTATEFVNIYAPEHLIIATDNPWAVSERINAAGSIFIGPYSPESAGDYASGTNHTLPTAGWAVTYSGVNLDSFMHKITYQELTKDGITALAPTIIAMAEAEGLEAHAIAAKIRTEKKH